NVHFITSVRQAPDFAEPGGKVERRNLQLELRLIADVGLVGLPNAGKSTLLSRLSAARPKIADYPFTTLVPQLGIAELDAERRLVLADIPGLIEGASTGHGLGLDFLRHIERTRVIVHIIDVLPLDETKPLDSYHEIRKELNAYSPKLAAKPEILVANKMDLAGASEALADLRDGLPGKQIMAISAVAGTGLRPLLEAIYAQVQKAPPSAPFIDPPAAILPPLPVAPETPSRDRKGATPKPVSTGKGLLALPDENVTEDSPPVGRSSGKPVKRKAARKTKPTAAAKRAAVAGSKKAASKPTAKVAKPAAVRKRKITKPVAVIDPELAAEIAAMKADDVRKSKYYGKKR
ncbi:MAG: GTPase, partial [Phycisphaerae bacterium]